MGVRLSDYIMADVMLHTSEVWLNGCSCMLQKEPSVCAFVV